jgi:hypothetical protein
MCTQQFDRFHVGEPAVGVPGVELRLSAVTGEPLLKAKVPDVLTRVRIWRGHPRWPETVAVGWG